MKRRKIIFIMAITFCLLNTTARAYALEDATDLNEDIPATDQPITEQQYTAAPTQAPTQRATQAPTQKVTQAPTQRATQAPTQKVTQAPTQRATQASTQKKTEATTQRQDNNDQYETTKYQEWTTQHQQNDNQYDEQDTEKIVDTEDTKKETEEKTEGTTTSNEEDKSNSSIPWVPIIVMCCIAALIPISFAIIKAMTRSKKKSASVRSKSRRAAYQTPKRRKDDIEDDEYDEEDTLTTEDLLEEDDDEEYATAPKRKKRAATVISNSQEELPIDKLSYDFTMRVLPEVPKGSKSIEDAMDVIDGMDEAEIKNIILTPLYIPGKDNLEKAEVEEIVNEVIEQSANDYGDIEFYWGHRVSYNKMLYKAVRAGKVSTLAGSRYLLVDFPEKTNLIDIMKCVVHLVDLGIRPIIAHVETLKDIDEIEECEDLINSGAYFMTDLSSYIGPKASYYKKHMENVFEHQMVSFIESDSKFVVGTTSKIYKPLDWVDSLCTEEYMYKMLVKNPQALIKNEEVDFKMV